MMALRPPDAGEPGPPVLAAKQSASASSTMSWRSFLRPVCRSALAYTMTKSGMVNATRACSEKNPHATDSSGMNTSRKSVRFFAGASSRSPMRRSRPVLVTALDMASTPKMKSTASLANACATPSGCEDPEEVQRRRPRRSWSPPPARRPSPRRARPPPASPAPPWPAGPPAPGSAPPWRACRRPAPRPGRACSSCCSTSRCSAPGSCPGTTRIP